MRLFAWKICRPNLQVESQAESILSIDEFHAGGSFERQLRDYKIKLAEVAVREHRGNKTMAARSPSISRAYLHRLIRSAEGDPLNPRETRQAETA